MSSQGTTLQPDGLTLGGDVTADLASRGHTGSDPEGALFLSHGHQKAEIFAKSALTPSHKAPVLDDANQDICVTEPNLDVSPYCRSRICEDKRKRLRPLKR